MPPDLLHILQHSLGCDQFGRPPPLGRIPNWDDDFGCYRNRFVTDPSSPDGQKCQQLVAQGFMDDHGAQRLAGGMHCYTVSQAGYDAMKAASPAPPKVSKAKHRWSAYRAMREVTGLTFEEYLRWSGRQEHEARHQYT